MKYFLLALTLFSVLAQAQQAPQREYNAARGHYFYEEPEPEDELTDEEKYPKPVIPSRERLMTMHPKEFSKLFEDQLEYSMMTMSEDDVLMYYELVNVSRLRSRAFMGVTEFVMMRNPHLDMQSVSPVNNPGRAEMNRQTEAVKRQKLYDNADTYALVMFAAESCGACKSQIAILDVFQRTYGFPVRIVDVNQAPDLARRYAVSRTPHMILIRKDSDDWMPIGIGVKSMPVVLNKTYSAIRLLNNEIEPAQFYNIDIDGGELYDPYHGLDREIE
ncbi:conjugal transfer protein TraF [Alteromonas macleodii]|uniref:F plasmid transfer operon family protein n=1 Tax=Alteromonas macleodii TaxID=28108 RepID=A0AB36FKY7_ALTMA|nr:conjugal transfer protein TraF [Alteromonas macleodii]OES24224.1 F plasmid transfer operon family protein [Alteromonas macleodii]OES24855.1 F plasmid transfer operon family protein [Alteromonas macleodii]OES25133.1 F plasmid transfer operon family protein [Alteromonas macleodii]OES39175.1 F plasmid transfer operon family protein [Alteromonas macleodii]